MNEIHYMLKELGLMPKSSKDRDEVSRLLQASDVDGNGEFNFTEFLELVKEIRTFWTNKKREEHLHSFEKYDREKRGMLSIADISAILAEEPKGAGRACVLYQSCRSGRFGLHQLFPVSAHRTACEREVEDLEV